MQSAKAGLSPRIPTFPSSLPPTWLVSPDRSFTITPSLHRRKRSGFGTGSTRSTPAGLSSEVAALRPSSPGKASSWEGSGSGPLCGRWASKGSIRGPISANGLFRTRSIRIFSGMSRPNILTTSGESTSPTSACLVNSNQKVDHRGKEKVDHPEW